MNVLFLFVLLLSLGGVGAEPYELDVEHYSVPIQEKPSAEIQGPMSDDSGAEGDPDYYRRHEEPTVHPKEPRSASAPNCSVYRETPESIRSRLWPKRKLEDEYFEPVDVTILAVQLYDHYKGRYRAVRRVESWVYRRSYYQHIIHCNRAKYASFDVTLYDLEKGDRFETRVTWDDGSHRSIDHTLGNAPQLKFYIDEPGYLEY